jgi:hypothetical protein
MSLNATWLEAISKEPRYLMLSSIERRKLEGKRFWPETVGAIETCSLCAIFDE